MSFISTYHIFIVYYVLITEDANPSKIYALSRIIYSGVHLVVIHWTVHLITFSLCTLYFLVKKLKKKKDVVWPQGIYSLVGKQTC